MRKTPLFSVLGCMALLLTASCVSQTATVQSQGLYTATDGLAVNCGVIELQRQNTPLAELDFKKSADGWDPAKTLNYEKRLGIAFGAQLDGTECLLITGGKPRKETDTAWQIESKPIALPDNGKFFSARVTACADTSFLYIAGNGHNSYMRWLDANGEELPRTHLNFTVTRRSFQTCQTTGAIPAGAKSAVIVLGYDTPNVDPGHFVALSKVTFGVFNADTPFVSQAAIETAQLEMAAPGISWVADCPPGTAIRIQMAEASDANGAPANWTPFHGPDGTASSFYDKPFKSEKPWCKLKIHFCADGLTAPVLKSLTAGGQTFATWAPVAGNQQPLVENLTVSPTHDRRQNIVFRITAQCTVNWASLEILIDGKKATDRFTRTRNLLTGKPAEDLADGLHTIELTVSNTEGLKTQVKKYLLVGDSPKNVPHVTLRDDGFTLVDGKPFFPIGIYAVWKREFNNNSFDKAFQDLGDAGFNFAHTYNSGAEMPDFFNAAHKHGFKVWARAYDINNEAFRKDYFNHPAIIAWYIGDDTSGHATPNQLQDCHDALKAIDDHRITTQADGVASNRPVSNYAAYVRGTDNFLPEIYPVHLDTPEDHAACVPIVIQDMDRIKADIDACGITHPRSIWPIIQYFKGWGGWKRFPTRDELFAMSYASIIHGATGITWYTYGGYFDKRRNAPNCGITTTPETWKNITDLTRQLRELSPVFLERTPEDQPVPQVTSGPARDAKGNPAVSCLLKRHNGETFLFAVNSSVQEVRAAIPVPGISTGELMFDNRTFAIRDGVLKDIFKPYGVNIYRLR